MKTSLFLLSFILFTFCGRAQTEFAPIGATWHIDYFQFVSTVGYEKIVAVKDTMILGKQAKKLELTRFTTHFFANGVINIDREDHYIYQTGDTVYHYFYDPYSPIMGDFTILYDFSLILGDTLFYEDDDYYFVIDSIGTVEMNGEEYRTQYGHFPHPFQIEQTTIINEKFGAMNDYLFLDITDFCFLDGPCQEFRCYEDDNFPLLQLADVECEHIPIFVSTNEPAPPPALLISPNPVRNRLLVAFSGPVKNAELHLFSPDGQRLKIWEIQNGSIQKELDLGGFPDGLYFIQWRQDGEALGRGKIMLQR